MNKGFWQGKRVLITGHQGFVGSHLSRALIKLGAEVMGLDIKSGDDVGDYELVQCLVAKRKPQIIYHLAAEAIVGNVHKIPRRAFVTNIGGTWNILEVTRTYRDIEATIIASSDKAYGEHRILPYREDFPLRAKYPYDASKACADMLAQSYINNYHLPIAITRCCNIFGPGDPNLCRLVPNAINCWLGNELLEVRGNGKFVRDFVYIDDVIRAYLLIAERFKKLDINNRVFNIGCNKPITIKEFVRLLDKLTHGNLCCKFVKVSYGEIKRQYLSACKAKRILGWKPEYTLQEGLLATMGKAIEHGAYC